jgi:hypothetical protein
MTTSAPRPRLGIGDERLAGAVAARDRELLGRRCRGDRERAVVDGQLDAQRAEPARAGVNKDGLAGLHVTVAVNRVPAGDALREERGGVDRRDAVGDGEHVVARRHDGVGVSAAHLGEDEHGQPRLGTVRGTLEHAPCDLEAGRERQRLVAAVLAAAHHRVGEVDADRIDGHEHLVRPALGYGTVHPGHDLGRAEPFQGHVATGAHRAAPASQPPRRRATGAFARRDPPRRRLA